MKADRAARKIMNKSSRLAVAAETGNNIRTQDLRATIIQQSLDDKTYDMIPMQSATARQGMLCENGKELQRHN